MKETYNGVEMTRDGAAIESGEGAARGRTPPFANCAQHGAPEKALASGMMGVESARSGAEHR